jgi:N-acyl-D-amino-acid deacylase
MEYDLLIKNGKIVDGTGSPWFKSDLGIKMGKILSIGKIRENAKTIIDASGLIVSPGWIDVHSHTDHTILGNTRCESYIHQGVTTVTMGNCGLSVYPLYQKYKEDLVSYLKPFTSGLNLNWDWVTLDDFLSKLELRGIGINLVPFVGHGSIKVNVMGFQDKSPSADEIEEMRHLLEEAICHGAYGMSTGLGYPPGVFTNNEEIIDLCKVLQEKGGIYSTHMRGDIANLKDTINLGNKIQVPIQVSHLGSSCASHKSLRGRHEEETLQIISKARENGLDITADIYPYIAGSSLLSQIIPDWVHEGGVERMLERLKEDEIRRKLDNEFKRDGLNKGRDFNKVLVTYVKSDKNKIFEGRTVAEISRMRNQSIVDTLCDLLIEEDAEAMNVTFWGMEEDVSTLVRHPAVMPCSDGWSHAPYGKLSQGKPHPRCYGAFPRYFRKYNLEQELFTLEEVIRRMTSMPASRLGIFNRALIRTGMAADLVIFDLETIKDRATFDAPHQYPEGIPYVIVNGEITINEGIHTGKLSGKVLRKGE